LLGRRRVQLLCLAGLEGVVGLAAAAQGSNREAFWRCGARIWLGLRRHCVLSPRGRKRCSHPRRRRFGVARLRRGAERCRIAANVARPTPGWGDAARQRWHAPAAAGNWAGRWSPPAATRSGETALRRSRNGVGAELGTIADVFWSHNRPNPPTPVDDSVVGKLAAGRPLAAAPRPRQRSPHSTLASLRLLPIPDALRCGSPWALSSRAAWRSAFRRRSALARPPTWATSTASRLSWRLREVLVSALSASAWHGPAALWSMANLRLRLASDR